MKRKGFTLVELLAVIIVLALILIIAIPTVINARTNAEKTTLTIQADKMLTNAMTKVAENKVKEQTLDGCYTYSELGFTDTTYIGSVLVSEDGTKYQIFVSDGSYYISGDESDDYSVLSVDSEYDETKLSSCKSDIDSNTYNITYNLNDGVLDSELSTYIAGSEVTLPTASKSGYTFAGWYSSLDYSGESISKIESSETGNKEYYAKWNTASLTLSVTATQDNVTVTSSTVSSPDGYTTLVIESLTLDGCNYGTNTVKIFVNGTAVKTFSGDHGTINSAVASVSTPLTYTVTSSSTLKITANSDRDTNRDDHQDAMTFTITYHYE